MMVRKPGPAVGIHVVEAVADPAEPVHLHRPDVGGVAEAPAGRQRQAEIDVGLARIAARRGRRGCRGAADAAAGAVERQHRR